MQTFSSNNILTFRYENKIDYHAASSYEDVMFSAKVNSFQFLELDFVKTRFITLPGAIFLLLTVTEIVESKAKKNEYVESRISNCSQDVLNILSNFGVLKMLILTGNLKLDPQTEILSNTRVEYWQKIIDIHATEIKSLYWPIARIPSKTNFDFYTATASFINNFINYFNLLIKCKALVRFDDEKSQFIGRHFIKAINEATKNVWDHSESWGVCSIQSTAFNKTTFCLFDYGIGFINSYIKRKGSYERSAETDKNVLRWLFKKGNTSNDKDNHGHGLATIAKFIDMTNGILLIRTDKYLIHYKDDKSLKIDEQKFFPGTAIMINF